VGTDFGAAAAFLPDAGVIAFSTVAIVWVLACFVALIGVSSCSAATVLVVTFFVVISVVFKFRLIKIFESFSRLQKYG
jgi:hypothetical protein